MDIQTGPKSNHTFHVRYYVEEEDILAMRLEGASSTTLVSQSSQLAHLRQLSRAQPVAVDATLG